MIDIYLGAVATVWILYRIYKLTKSKNRDLDEIPEQLRREFTVGLWCFFIDARVTLFITTLAYIWGTIIAVSFFSGALGI